ncbi:hypothetical protein DFH27DRAFT_518235 [Peziza echinospora]|nr:hypothetical protein DFH27DRAFT_518235 [Peziza echinospora]
MGMNPGYILRGRLTLPNELNCALKRRSNTFNTTCTITPIRHFSGGAAPVFLRSRFGSSTTSIPQSSSSASQFRNTTTHPQLPRIGRVPERFYTTSTSSSSSDPSDPFSTPAKRLTPTPISTNTYHTLADATLDNLLFSLEELADAGGPPKILDVEYSSGVLNLVLEGKGTWVINKQPPNKQIWLSSPVSGPRRFDWVDKRDVWRYGVELGELLKGEISEEVDLEGI